MYFIEVPLEFAEFAQGKAAIALSRTGFPKLLAATCRVTPATSKSDHNSMFTTQC